MVYKTYNIMLDIFQALGVPRIDFVQGDHKGSVLNVTLQNNGSSIDMTGLSAQFCFKKPDGGVVKYDTRTDADNIVISNVTNGIVAITMSDDALDMTGMGIGQVSIVDSTGAKVTSQAFNIYVRYGCD